MKLNCSDNLAEVDATAFTTWAEGSAREWSEDAGREGSMRSAAFYLGVSMVSIMVSGLFGTMPFIYPFWVPVAGMLVVGNLARQES